MSAYRLELEGAAPDKTTLFLTIVFAQNGLEGTTHLVAETPRWNGAFHDGFVSNLHITDCDLACSATLKLRRDAWGPLSVEPTYALSIRANLHNQTGSWEGELQGEANSGSLSCSPIHPTNSAQTSRVYLTCQQAFTTCRKDFRDLWLTINPGETGSYASTFHQNLQAVVPFTTVALNRTERTISGTVTLEYPGWSDEEIPPRCLTYDLEVQLVGDRSIGRFRGTGDIAAEEGAIRGIVLPPLQPSHRAFSHPGLLNTTDELDKICSKVQAGVQPWATAWNALQTRAEEFLTHQPRARAFLPFVHHFQPGPSRDLKEDLEALYGNTLLFCISGDEAYAQAATKILSAWVAILEEIELQNPSKEGYLSTGYFWPTAVWAAELLRSRYSGWSNAKESAFTKFLREKIAPVVEVDLVRNNWLSWAICCQMSLAIYLDDGNLFDEACRRFRLHLPRYIIKPTGQSGETFRDLVHAQMGIAPLLAAAEMAWKQGVDLYSLADNRLFAAVCFHAPFVLGKTEGWPGKKPPKKTGIIWPMYELAAWHYVGRMGLQDDRLDEIRAAQHPEPFNRIGWGTLTHANGLQ